MISQGKILAYVAASRIYGLLGKAVSGTNQIPAPDVALTKGLMAFQNRGGDHTDNWVPATCLKQYQSTSL